MVCVQEGSQSVKGGFAGQKGEQTVYVWEGNEWGQVYIHSRLEPPKKRENIKEKVKKKKTDKRRRCDDDIWERVETEEAPGDVKDRYPPRQCRSSPRKAHEKKRKKYSDKTGGFPPRFFPSRDIGQ